MAKPVDTYSRDDNNAVAPAVSARPERASATDIASLVWIIGMGFSIFAMGAGAIWVYFLKKDSKSLGNRSTAAILERQLSSQSVGAVQISFSSKVSSAFVSGIRKPVIYLPESIENEFNADQIDAILCHEIVHIRQGDCLWAFLSRLTCALVWPNPLMWMIARDLTFASEELCDQLVLGTGIEATTYAGCLLRVAESTFISPRQRLVGAGVFPTKSQLSRRISLVLNHQNNSSIKPTRNIFLKISAVGLTVAVGACLLVSAAPIKLVKHDSTPEATMQSMIDAFNRQDWKGVFSRMEGAKVEAAAAKVQELQKAQKLGTPTLSVKYGPFTTTNDTATAHVVIGFVEAADGKAHVSSEDDITLHRQNGDWKLVGGTKKGSIIYSLVEIGRNPERVDRVRATAKFSILLSDMKQIALAVMMYLADHDDKLSFSQANLKASLTPYLANKSIWNGSDGKPLDVQFNQALKGRSITTFEAPSKTVLLTLGRKGALIFSNEETPVAFMDGHVRMTKRSDVPSLRWE